MVNSWSTSQQVNSHSLFLFLSVCLSSSTNFSAKKSSFAKNMIKNITAYSSFHECRWKIKPAPPPFSRKIGYTSVRICDVKMSRRSGACYEANLEPVRYSVVKSSVVCRSQQQSKTSSRNEQNKYHRRSRRIRTLTAGIPHRGWSIKEVSSFPTMTSITILTDVNKFWIVLTAKKFST